VDYSCGAVEKQPTKVRQ